MPARVSRPSSQAAQPKPARNKNRKRNLDAFSAAAKLIPSDTGVRQNRLGELLDDGPKSKRRRTGNDPDEDNEDSEDDAPTAKPEREAGTGGDVEHGSDSEGNQWTLGGLREDDEDSELDSDEAFGESDEERFAGYTFRGSSSLGPRKRKPHRHSSQREDDEGDVDLDEGGSSADDEENDDFGHEGVDLATMLDDDEDEREDLHANDEVDNTASDQSDEEKSSASADESNDGDVEMQAERIARMRDRIDALDDIDEAGKSKILPQSMALTVEDLLAEADASARKQYAAPLKTRKQSERPKTLAAPLAPRQQDRLNREVASRKAKEQLDRWRDTVMHNRRADFLSFPLRDPDRGEPAGKGNFIQNVPQNELESHIHRIMQDSGLASTTDRNGRQENEETSILQSEGLAEKNMPIEEVARRRAELRRARDLLFREEIKAKRIAKIKSKSYRRVHRKERERNAAREASDDEDEEKDARADRKRAEARMGTKHRDSKWAKSLKATNRAVWDDEARNSVNEQARRKEELRERIAGKELHDEAESDVPSIYDSDAFDPGKDMSQTLQHLDLLQRQERDVKAASSGLAGMKFMLEAEERQRKRNDEDVEQLRKELTDDHDLDNDEEEANTDDQELGRAIFGPRGKEVREEVKKAKRPELEEGDVSEEEEQDQAPQPDEVVIKTNAISQKARPTDRASAAEGTRKQTVVTYNDEDASDAASDSQDGRKALASDRSNIPLHRRAFAGDNVKAAFDAEKAEAVASDEEKEVSNHLPGWGSWTGEGLSKSIRKANDRQRHNPIYKTKLAGVKAQDRKDAKLENVLISEKQDRKGKKYKADILPHEFEKKQQYERSLRLPMGPEWVTKETFQKHTRPRVVVKPGVIVAPMERPLL